LPEKGLQFRRIAILDLARPIYPNLKDLMPEIERVYTVRAEYLGVANPPPREVNRRRHQIDAYSLLRHFSRKVVLPNGSMGLLLTDQDLFVSIYNFIFGLAEPELRWAVLSTHRLQSPSMRLYLSRVKKEVIHEIGHLAGLAHCGNRKCVMAFSNTVEQVDQKSADLCPACERVIAPKFQ
jgi:archaemetzincin